MVERPRRPHDGRDMDDALEGAPDDAGPHPPSPPLELALRAIVILFTAFLVLGGLTQVSHVAFGLWFTQLFLFLGLSACLLRRSGRDPVRFPGLVWRGTGPVAVGFLLGVTNFLAVIAPLQFLTYLLVPEALQQSTDQLLFERQSPLQLAAVVGAVALAAPFCEEYFFRGVLQPSLRRAGLGAVRSVIITAAVFSAFHLQPVKLLPLFELGLLFGLLRLRTRSLWPAIAAHAGNNTVTTLAFLSSPEQPAGAGAAELEQGAVALVAGLGGLLFLALLWTIRRYPRLLPPRAPEPDTAALPPVPASRLYGPWAAAMVVSLALLLALDWREVRLNLHDFGHPLPAPSPDAPPDEAKLRTGLEALRARAERGEAPLDEYFEARDRLASGRPRLPAAAPRDGTPLPEGG